MGIRRKLYLLIGVCALGFICSVAADRIGKHYTAKYRHLMGLAANAYTELLQARREEKNFLLHLDPQRVAPALAHADKVKEDITLLSGQDAALAQEVRGALTELAAYRKGFEDLVAIERVKGFNEHQGLMRNFVYAARDLDTKFKPVTDKDFQIVLLTIRRHEKNWQLRDEETYVDKVDASVKELGGLVAANPDLTPEQKKNFATVIDTYQRSFKEYVAASAKAKKIAAAMVQNGRDLMPHFEKIEHFYATRRSEVQTTVDWAMLAVQSMLGVVVLFVILWIIRGITGSLSSLGAYSRQVASGDLEARPRGRFERECAALRDDITAMVANLKEKMRQVAEEQAEASRQARAAEEAMLETKRKEEELASTLDRMQGVADEAANISRRLSNAAQDLSAQTEQSASGVELQRRRVDETATAIAQMNATILEIAGNAGSAAQTAEQARDNATTGADVVKQAGKSMATVNDIAIELKADMGSLGQEAQSIGEVVGVINDIADQTNLLALNAAIEAARAGEAGRGFAVVADEVRKLAEKTMVATKEVESRIRAIQDAAGRNIKSMDQAVSAVADANALAGRSGEAILAIVGHADATSGQVQAIATAAEEQSAASEQISRAITEINQVADDNVAGVEATAKAARSLAAMADELKGLITRLRGDRAETTGPRALAA
ncbi:methyl-accepting chemotaxis sensory transducer [Solidesulfovibrio fructosivorans JJ]]|uniref:Methyl-accepting chemotaxis sensory transducer n=1 Tax=Solidesulfovibrio fructosivorans JJ] TaxID=596151 RepID=E1JUF4_SOLFR|nr:methyl-accepting chemotaxis protein [Solidesulfovibrio fructosivorans]EFL52084.1 methyl-accepting chemotaxis sensory transducer [Solidesulfovibrio fructosivorans JJ]]